MYAENKATLTNPFIKSDARSWWEQALKGGGQCGGNRQHDNDAMDINAVWMAPLSDEEKKHLQAENRCFFCKNQGHISRNCQKKSHQQGGGVPASRTNQPHVQATEAEGMADDAALAANSANALQMIKGLNKEERTQLLDSLILESQDF
jgi:hypothetical protein